MDRRGDLIRLRSRTWFFERPREIPLRFVRRCRESYETAGGLSFDQYLEMATQLRDLQLHQLSDLVMAGALPANPLELRSAYDARHALRLYAMLSAPECQTLLGGGALHLAGRTPVQRELFALAVRELRRPSPLRPPSPSAAREPTAADWESATFAVSARRVEGFPLGLPSFGPGPAGAGPGAPPPSASPAPPPGAGPPGGSRPNGGRPPRPPRVEWEFVFQVGAALRQSVSLSTVAAAPPGKASARGGDREER
jgi:hypothetical protein